MANVIAGDIGCTTGMAKLIYDAINLNTGVIIPLAQQGPMKASIYSFAQGICDRVNIDITGGGAGGATIEDNDVTPSTTWSSTKISKVPDVLTATAGQTDYTLTGTPIFPTGSRVLLNGVEIDYTSMYTITADVISIVQAGLGYNLETGMTLKVWWW